MINEGQEYLNVDRPLRLRNRLPLWSLPSPYRCWTKHGHPIYMAHSIEGSLDLKLSTNSSFKVAGLHEYATVSYVYRCVRWSRIPNNIIYTLSFSTLVSKSSTSSIWNGALSERFSVKASSHGTLHFIFKHRTVPLHLHLTIGISSPDIVDYSSWDDFSGPDYG